MKEKLKLPLVRFEDRALLIAGALPDFISVQPFV